MGFPHAAVIYWDLRNFFDPRNYQSKSQSDLPLPDYVGMNGESLAATGDGKYIWYKVTLNITKTGTKYRLLHDGTNITNL